ncbi:MAG TPA: Rieske (2Fe-2S) protein [Candidatus Binatia bacterium]|jgi:nitrite reductase/ring-hydroxylating ferredoxin subunit
MSGLARICPAAEVPAEGAKLVALDQRELAIIAHGGKYYAVENSCPHKGGPLGLGQVKNGVITCPWHRFRFELESGKSVTNPAMRATIHRLVVEQGDLLMQTIERT